MIRLLAIFAILFAGGITWVSLLPNPSLATASRSAAAALGAEADQAPTQPKIRVVYPAPGTNGTSQPTVQTSASLVAATPNSAAPNLQPALYPQMPTAPSPDVTPVVPSNDAVPTGMQGVNLNTASIEALNQIPGAGRIGRTIADHRPYRSVEDLLAKRVIRKSVYDRIKGQVAAE